MKTHHRSGGVRARAFITGLCLSATSPAGEMRVFHSAEGKPLTASFENISGDTVTLRREVGKVFQLAKDKLSAEDQLYLSGLAQRSGDEAKKLNAAAGHRIANAKPFAERKADELAELLQLRPESQSKYGRSWRLYAALLLFGKRPPDFRHECEERAESECDLGVDGALALE